MNLACPLDTAGTHTLIVEANIFTTNYSVSAQRSNNPAGCTAISFGGGPSTGSFVDAEMDCYTFSAAAGDQVRVRRFGTSGATHVEALVFGPDGDPVNCFDATERTCAIDTTGTYTILVRDDPFSGLETGTYALAIQRLNNPVGCTPLSFGAAPFVGSITAAAEIDCYAFSGAPGDQIQIALPVTSSSGARTGDVFDPNGDVVCTVTRRDPALHALRDRHLLDPRRVLLRLFDVRLCGCHPAPEQPARADLHGAQSSERRRRPHRSAPRERWTATRSAARSATRSGSA